MGKSPSPNPKLKTLNPQIPTLKVPNPRSPNKAKPPLQKQLHLPEDNRHKNNATMEIEYPRRIVNLNKIKQS